MGITRRLFAGLLVLAAAAGCQDSTGIDPSEAELAKGGNGNGGGGNPHFIRNHTSASIQKNGRLKISFKIAGLGNRDITVKARADVDVHYDCGDVDPPVTARREITKNGSAKSSLELKPPSAPCKGGRLTRVVYRDIRLTADRPDDKRDAAVVEFGTMTRRF